MQIKFSTSYQRTYKKLIKKNPNLINIIAETIKIFEINKNDPRLHFKHIICKFDKYRYSIRVINTQYRILMTCINNICEFRFILDHDDYQRKNKDC